jgi:hypothetical protein
VVLIIWVSLLSTLFLCALLYYCLKGQYLGRSNRSAYPALPVLLCKSDPLLPMTDPAIQSASGAGKKATVPVSNTLYGTQSRLHSSSG